MPNASFDSVSGGGNDVNNRQWLKEIVSRDAGSAETSIRDILQAGADHLHVDLGLLIRVQEGTDPGCRVVASNEPAGAMTEGLTGELLATYCKMVRSNEGPFAVQNELQTSMPENEGFVTAGIGTFVGVDVIVGGESFGTVCFVSWEESDDPLGGEDRAFLEEIGQAVGAVLNRQFDALEEFTDGEMTVDDVAQPVLRPSPVIIAEVDEELRYKWVHDPYSDQDPERVIGKRDDELGSGPGVEQLVALKETALQRGEQVRKEIVLDRGQGLRVYDVIATPVRDGPDETVTGLITASLNITERREQQRKYRESEARYRALAENFPSGAVGVYDQDLRYMLVAGTILGEGLPEVDDLKGQRMPDIFPEHTVADIEPICRRAVDDGIAGSVETEFGGRYWKVWATPLHDAQGEVFAGLSFTQDITERKQREDTLQKQRNLLEQAERLAGAWELDLRTGESSWSDTVYEIHELPVGMDLDLQDVFRFYPPDARTKIRGAFQRCVDEGTPYDVEVPIVTAEDNRRWVRAVGAPAVVVDGQVVKVAGAFQDVTERKRAERRRRRVIHRVTDAIVKVDADWRFTLVNDQAEALYDMEESDLLGNSFWEVFSSALGTRFEETYRTVMRTREPASLVEYYSDLEGWFDVHAYPSEDGGIAFYFQDVTKQKQKEAALRRQRNLLQQTQRLAGAWEADLETGALTWSTEMYRIHGLSPGTPVTVEDGIEFYAPEARSEVRVLLDRCVEQDIPFDVELPIHTAQGTERWVRAVGARVDGEEQKIAGALQDITERKSVERELREKEEHLRDLANTVPGVVIQFYARSDGTYGNHFVSEHAESVLGISPDPETFLERCFECVPDTHVDGLRASIKEAVEEQKPWRHEMPFVKPSGERIWLLGTTTPRQREDELVFNGVILDITERKQVEQELREAKNGAEEAARLKAAMLANVSHEVRTPLTSILGFAETMSDAVEALESGEASAEDIEVLGRSSAMIQKSGRRLLDTLDSVLNLSKLEAGIMDLRPERLDLMATVWDVAEMFYPKAETAGLDLQIEPGESVWVHADPHGLHIVLQNLLSNAVKYTERGGTVVVRVREEESWVLLEVEDTGVGMDPAVVHDLFEAFRQESEGLAREYEGAGIGLAVTKQVIDEMSCEMNVETAPAEGSCFRVRVPKADEPDDEVVGSHRDA